MNTTQNKIESIKQVIEVMKELEDIDIELNKKCKQSGDNIDMLKQLVTESNKNLEAAEHAFFMQLRETRDQLLFATDWTQVADAPVDQAMWAEYRQKLRELPVECRDKYNQELKALLPAPPQLLKNIAKFY